MYKENKKTKASKNLKLAPALMPGAMSKGQSSWLKFLLFTSKVLLSNWLKICGHRHCHYLGLSMSTHILKFFFSMNSHIYFYFLYLLWPLYLKGESGRESFDFFFFFEYTVHVVPWLSFWWIALSWEIYNHSFFFWLFMNKVQILTSNILNPS